MSVRDEVVAELLAIAPEVEEGDLSDSELLRDQVDLGFFRRDGGGLGGH